MDNKADKKIDEFTEKLLKNLSRESPSFDFTTKVMSQVDVASNATAVKYKPLISKRVWFVLAVLLSGIFSYLLFGNVQMENSLVFSNALDLLPEINSVTLPNYQVSNVFLYGVLGFTFFVSIQVLLLKNHFNKRFA